MTQHELTTLFYEEGWTQHPTKWYSYRKEIGGILWHASIGTIPNLPHGEDFVVYIRKFKESGKNYYTRNEVLEKLKEINLNGILNNI